MTYVPPLLTPAGAERSADLADEVEALETDDVLRLFVATAHELLHRRQRAGKTTREVVEELIASIEQVDEVLGG